MIVDFGSLNVDLTIPVAKLPIPGETVLGPGYGTVPGGKGANQALAAARAGAKVHMAGRVGRDGMAEIALAELRKAGVDLAQVETDDRPTGIAAICIDRAGQNMIIVASGANMSAQEVQIPDAQLGPGTIVMLQMEVPLEENWALVARASLRGAKVLLNAAPAGPIPGIALAALDWLIVNEHEAVTVAASLGLGALEPKPAAHTISRTADIAVIVTLGGEGAVAYAPDGNFSIGALPVTPVDTVAAGDAFVGAFAAAMDAGADLPGALRYGSVAGGLACLVRGAQSSLPTKAMIDARFGDLQPAKVLES